MRKFRCILTVSVLFILISCNPSPDEIPVMATRELATPMATIRPFTKTPSPTVTFTPTVSATTSPPPDTNTPKPIFQLCSPLADQTLQEIPEIVSDPYNPPGPGKDDRHHGTDLAYYRRKNRTTIAGEAIQTMLAGVVVAVVEDQLPYGNMVIIETGLHALPPEMIALYKMLDGDALYTLYAHFGNPPIVTLGEQVVCGQTLGEVGATGYNIVNPHLHIETRVGPAEHMFVDGMAYYDTRTTEVERTNYELWRTSGVFRHFDPMILLNNFLLNGTGG